MTDQAMLYRDDEGNWRWVRRAANNEVVAAASEGYSRKVDAVYNYNTVSGPDAPELREEDEKA